MRSLITLLVLSLLTQCTRMQPNVGRPHPDDSSPRTAPDAAHTPAVVVNPAICQGFTTALTLRNAPFARNAMPSVVVHAPQGFDPSQRLHIVLFAHSWGSYAMQWLASGTAPVLPNRPPMVGWGLDSRHDVARTNTLLIAPQFDAHRPRNWAGPFARRTFLREFLQEILHDALAQRLGVHSVDDIESITLVGSSAGGVAADAIVSHSDLVAKIRNVILFDGFYGGASTFASWLARDPQRRFVSVHGGGHSTANPARELTRLLTPSLRRSLALNPSAALSEVVRTHRVVIAQSSVEHIAMTLVYYAKVISALNFPLISAQSTAKTPIGTLRDAVALTVGQPVVATIALSDQPLRDGSRCDDYALELREGQAIEVDVRGGRSASEGTMPLDVVVQLLDGTQIVAENDDVAAGFRARLSFVAQRSTRYTLRVSTHGPWPRLGPYTVVVR